MDTASFIVGYALGRKKAPSGSGGEMKYIIDNSTEILSVPVNEIYRFSWRLFRFNDTDVSWAAGKDLYVSQQGGGGYPPFYVPGISVDGDGYVSYAFAGRSYGVIAFVCLFENDTPVYAVSTSQQLHYDTYRDIVKPVGGDPDNGLIVKYGCTSIYEYDLNSVVFENFTAEDLTFYNPSNEYFNHRIYIKDDYNSTPKISMEYTDYVWDVVYDSGTSLPDHLEYRGKTTEKDEGIYFSAYVYPHPGNLLHYDEGTSHEELWQKYMNVVSYINSAYYGKNTRSREKIIPDRPE